MRYCLRGFPSGIDVMQKWIRGNCKRIDRVSAGDVARDCGRKAFWFSGLREAMCALCPFREMGIINTSSESERRAWTPKNGLLNSCR